MESDESKLDTSTLYRTLRGNGGGIFAMNSLDAESTLLDDGTASVRTHTTAASHSPSIGPGRSKLDDASLMEPVAEHANDAEETAPRQTRRTAGIRLSAVERKYTIEDAELRDVVKQSRNPTSEQLGGRYMGKEELMRKNLPGWVYIKAKNPLRAYPRTDRQRERRKKQGDRLLQTLRQQPVGKDSVLSRGLNARPIIASLADTAPAGELSRQSSLTLPAADTQVPGSPLQQPQSQAKPATDSKVDSVYERRLRARALNAAHLADYEQQSSKQMDQIQLSMRRAGTSTARSSLGTARAATAENQQRSLASPPTTSESSRRPGKKLPVPRLGIPPAPVQSAVFAARAALPPPLPLPELPREAEPPLRQFNWLLCKRWYQRVQINPNPALHYTWEKQWTVAGIPKAPAMRSQSRLLLSHQTLQHLLLAAVPMAVSDSMMQQQSMQPLPLCMLLPSHEGLPPSPSQALLALALWAQADEDYQLDITVLPACDVVKPRTVKADGRVLMNIASRIALGDESSGMALADGMPEVDTADLQDIMWAHEAWNDLWAAAELDASTAELRGSARPPDAAPQRWGEYTAYQPYSGSGDYGGIRFAERVLGKTEFLVLTPHVPVDWPVNSVDLRSWAVSGAVLEKLCAELPGVRRIRMGPSQAVNLTPRSILRVAQLQSLAHLHLPGCTALGLDVATALASTAVAANLLSIDVSWCPQLDDEAFLTLAKGLKRVRALVMQGLPVTNACMRQAANALEFLEAIDVSWCPRISQPGLTPLLAGCPLIKFAARGMGRGMIDSAAALEAAEAGMLASAAVAAPGSAAPGTPASSTLRTVAGTSRWYSTMGSTAKTGTDLQQWRFVPDHSADVQAHAAMTDDPLIRAYYRDAMHGGGEPSLVAAGRQGLPLAGAPDHVWSMQGKVLAPMGPGFAGADLARQMLVGAEVELQTVLTAIDLEGAVGVTDTTVISIVRNSPYLQRIRLNHSPELTAASTTAIFLNCHHLTHLSMAYCTGVSSPIVDDVAVQALAAVRTNAESHQPGFWKRLIREAARSGTRRSVLEPASPLIVATQLRQLDISGCAAITQVDAIALMQTCKDLTRLRASCVPDVGDPVMQCLQLGSGALTTLSMRHCLGISNESADFIASALPSLRELDVTGCTGLSDRGFVRIARACPLLRILRANQCSSSFTAGGVLATCMMCRQLRILEASPRTQSRSRDLPRSPRLTGVGLEQDEAEEEPDFTFMGNQLLLLCCIGLCCPHLQELDMSNRVLDGDGDVAMAATVDLEGAPQWRGPLRGLADRRAPAQPYGKPPPPGVLLEDIMAGRVSLNDIIDPTGKYPHLRDPTQERFNFSAFGAHLQEHSAGRTGAQSEHAPRFALELLETETGPVAADLVLACLVKLKLRHSGRLEKEELRQLVGAAPALQLLDVTQCDGVALSTVSELAAARPGVSLVVRRARVNAGLHPDSPLKATLASMTQRSQISTQSSMRHKLSRKMSMKDSLAGADKITPLPQATQLLGAAQTAPAGRPGEELGLMSTRDLSAATVPPKGGALSGGVTRAPGVGEPPLAYLGFEPVPSASFVRDQAVTLARVGLERRVASSIQVLVRHGLFIQRNLRYTMTRRLSIKNRLKQAYSARRITRFMQAVARFLAMYKYQSSASIQMWYRRQMLRRRCTERLMEAIRMRRVAQTKRLAAGMLLMSFDRMWLRMGFDWLRMRALVGRWEDERQINRLRGLVPRYDNVGKFRVQFAVMESPEVLGDVALEAAEAFAHGRAEAADTLLQVDLAALDDQERADAEEAGIDAELFDQYGRVLSSADVEIAVAAEARRTHRIERARTRALVREACARIDAARLASYQQGTVKTLGLNNKQRTKQTERLHGAIAMVAGTDPDQLVLTAQGFRIRREVDPMASPTRARSMNIAPHVELTGSREAAPSAVDAALAATASCAATKMGPTPASESAAAVTGEDSGASDTEQLVEPTDAAIPVVVTHDLASVQQLPKPGSHHYQASDLQLSPARSMVPPPSPDSGSSSASPKSPSRKLSAHDSAKRAQRQLQKPGIQPAKPSKFSQAALAASQGPAPLAQQLFKKYSVPETPATAVRHGVRMPVAYPEAVKKLAPKTADLRPIQRPLQVRVLHVNYMFDRSDIQAQPAAVGAGMQQDTGLIAHGTASAQVLSAAAAKSVQLRDQNSLQLARRPVPGTPGASPSARHRPASAALMADSMRPVTEGSNIMVPHVKNPFKVRPGRIRLALANPYADGEDDSIAARAPPTLIHRWLDEHNIMSPVDKASKQSQGAPPRVVGADSMMVLLGNTAEPLDHMARLLGPRALISAAIKYIPVEIEALVAKRRAKKSSKEQQLDALERRRLAGYARRVQFAFREHLLRALVSREVARMGADDAAAAAAHEEARGLRLPVGEDSCSQREYKAAVLIQTTVRGFFARSYALRIQLCRALVRLLAAAQGLLDSTLLPAGPEGDQALLAAGSSFVLQAGLQESVESSLIRVVPSARRSTGLSNMLADCAGARSVAQDTFQVMHDAAAVRSIASQHGSYVVDTLRRCIAWQRGPARGLGMKQLLSSGEHQPGFGAMYDEWGSALAPDRMPRATGSSMNLMASSQVDASSTTITGDEERAARLLAEQAGVDAIRAARCQMDEEQLVQAHSRRLDRNFAHMIELMLGRMHTADVWMSRWLHEVLPARVATVQAYCSTSKADSDIWLQRWRRCVERIKEEKQATAKLFSVEQRLAAARISFREELMSSMLAARQSVVDMASEVLRVMRSAEGWIERLLELLSRRSVEDVTYCQDIVEQLPRAKRALQFVRRRVVQLRAQMRAAGVQELPAESEAGAGQSLPAPPPPDQETLLRVLQDDGVYQRVEVERDTTIRQAPRFRWEETGEWEVGVSANGRKFWHNKHTKQSTWAEPTWPPGAAPPAQEVTVRTRHIVRRRKDGMSPEQVAQAELTKHEKHRKLALQGMQLLLQEDEQVQDTSSSREPSDMQGELRWLQSEETELQLAIERMELFAARYARALDDRAREEAAGILELEGMLLRLSQVQQDFRRAQAEAMFARAERTIALFVSGNTELLAELRRLQQAQALPFRGMATAPIFKKGPRRPSSKPGSAGSAKKSAAALLCAAAKQSRLLQRNCVAANPLLIMLGGPPPLKYKPGVAMDAKQPRPRRVPGKGGHYKLQIRTFRPAVAAPTSKSRAYYSVTGDGEDLGNDGFWYVGRDRGVVYGLLGVRMDFGCTSTVPDAELTEFSSDGEGTWPDQQPQLSLVASDVAASRSQPATKPKPRSRTSNPSKQKQKRRGGGSSPGKARSASNSPPRAGSPGRARRTPQRRQDAVLACETTAAHASTLDQQTRLQALGDAKARNKQKYVRARKGRQLMFRNKDGDAACETRQVEGQGVHAEAAAQLMASRAPSRAGPRDQANLTPRTLHANATKDYANAVKKESLLHKGRKAQALAAALDIMPGSAAAMEKWITAMEVKLDMLSAELTQPGPADEPALPSLMPVTQDMESSLGGLEALLGELSQEELSVLQAGGAPGSAHAEPTAGPVLDSARKEELTLFPWKAHDDEWSLRTSRDGAHWGMSFFLHLPSLQAQWKPPTVADRNRLLKAALFKRAEYEAELEQMKNARAARLAELAQERDVDEKAMHQQAEWLAEHGGRLAEHVAASTPLAVEVLQTMRPDQICKLVLATCLPEPEQSQVRAGKLDISAAPSKPKMLRGVDVGDTVDGGILSRWRHFQEVKRVFAAAHELRAVFESTRSMRAVLAACRCRQDFAALQGALQSIQANADAADTPLWWRLMNLRDDLEKLDRGFAKGNIGAGTQATYLQRLSAQWEYCQGVLLRMKSTREELEASVVRQLELIMSRLIRRPPKPLPAAAVIRQDASADITDAKAEAKFREAVSKRYAGAKRVLEEKLRSKAPVKLGITREKAATMAFHELQAALRAAARRAATQRAEAAGIRPPAPDELVYDSDEEAYNQWAELNQPRFQSKGFYVLVSLDGRRRLVWAGDGTQFLESEWVASYQARPWVVRAELELEGDAQAQQDGMLHLTGGALDAYKITVEPGQRGLHARRAAVAEKRAELERQKAMDRVQEQRKLIQKLRRRIQKERQLALEFRADHALQFNPDIEEIDAVGVDSKGPERGVGASLGRRAGRAPVKRVGGGIKSFSSPGAALRFIMEKTGARATAALAGLTARLPQTGAARKLRRFRKERTDADGQVLYRHVVEGKHKADLRRAEDQAVLHALYDVRLVVGKHSNALFAVEQSRAADAGNPFCLQLAGSLGAKPSVPVHLWYRKTDQMVDAIGHMVVHPVAMSAVLGDELRDSEYQACTHAVGMPGLALWYLRGTGRPITAAAITIGSEQDEAMKQKGFQLVVADWQGAPLVHPEARIWYKWGQATAANQFDDELVRLAHVELEAMKVSHASLLAHTQALAARDEPIPDWKAVALHTIDVEIDRRAGGYLQHGAQQLQESALKLLGFTVEELKLMEDRFTRVGLNEDNKLTMSTLFRYVSVQATPFLETLLFALDDELQPAMSLAVFLRSVGLLCAMSSTGIAQFLYGVLMPTLANKVPWFGALRRPDGSAHRGTWWHGLGPWQGLGSGSSPPILPVICMELLLKAMHAVGSDARPLVHVAVDDAHSISRGGMLDYDMFCAMAHRYAPLFAPVFSFQAACRRELGGSKFWQSKAATWDARWQPAQDIAEATQKAWDEYWSQRLSEQYTFPDASTELRRLEAAANAAAQPAAGAARSPASDVDDE